MNKGLLIVIDGIDGSGKTTQIEFLSKYFQEKSIPFEVISFPRYQENEYGKLVKRYLEGEFGAINKVDPYWIAEAYAADRLLAKPEIENWLQNGKLIIANRYVSASKAHLGANLDESKREDFIKWVDQLEYQTNGMPKPDLVILLNVDPKMGQENALKAHLTDIHEKSLEHEEKAAQIYLELSQSEKNWVVINCMENDKMNPEEKIHREILKILSKARALRALKV
ncbi:dTMP kinase [Candidatus Daviesbacteria bacterium]|nr:dTMP kinase [Candidatus Daviesbacteria bacterium]